MVFVSDGLWDILKYPLMSSIGASLQIVKEREFSIDSVGTLGREYFDGQTCGHVEHRVDAVHLQSDLGFGGYLERTWHKMDAISETDAKVSITVVKCLFYTSV